MKIFIFAILVTQVLCSPPRKQVSPSSRGVLDTLLSGPSRICLCRCGLPNKEQRSLDSEDVPDAEVISPSAIIQTEDKIDENKDTKEKLEAPTQNSEDKQKDKPAKLASKEATSRRATKPKGQGKLIGGDVPPTHVFPWLILVIRKGEIAAGGALISDSHVITSASPIAKDVAYDVKVRVAVHDRCVGDVTSSNVSVEAIVVHPAYSPASRAHDIALLRLANSLKFDRRLHPICLPNPRTVYNGEVATIVSWLSPMPDGGTPSCEPHRLRQPILPDTDCSRAVTSPNLLTPDKSCIGVVGSKSLLCSGDVGAPIQFLTSSGKYELVGLITDINVCDQTNSTLFTRVADHLNWITQVTSNDCLCRI